jgi:vancomycin resistance protein YoaR
MGKKLTLLGIFVGSTALGLALQVTFSGQVAPGTMALNSNISFEEAEKVQEDLSLALEEFETAPVSVMFLDEVYEFSLDELGVTLNKTDTIESVPVITPISASWLGKREVTALHSLDSQMMQEVLNDKIINLNVAPAEPRISWNNDLQDFEFSKEQDGWIADLKGFYEQLEAQVSLLDSSVIEIETVASPSMVTKQEMELYKTDLIALVNASTTIFYGNEEWEVKWYENLHLLEFEPAENPGQTAIQVTVDEGLITEHISRYIAPEIEIAPENVTVLQGEEGDISFEGVAVDGLTIDYNTLTDMLSYALNNSLTKVEIPLVETPGEVNTPAALQELGITELVSTGYSSFYGSTYNRMHNINIAIERFDGVLVAPGETFSFGDQLGLVDGSTGYAKELVIKENETIPEYGGGICQVSSTMFRAILFGGFPIDYRKAHSYAVSYYAYPLGWGLDATVYPPAVDLKFTNDLDSHLLVQAYTDGYLATFKFYGTKDGRAVEMDGPYISNRLQAPPAIYEITSELAPGEIEQVDTAHNGFTATWTRAVTYPDGTDVEEVITSPYQAWAAKYLVGEGTEDYEQE